MKIVFLGCTKNLGIGFNATNSKVSFMAKGLKLAGNNCVIHNGIEGTRNTKVDMIRNYEGFEVTTYKERKYSMISFFINIRKTYKYLKQEHVKAEKNVAILEYNLVHIFVVYVILLRLTGYKIVDISHEWYPLIKKRLLLKKYSDILFSKIFGYLVDGVLPISEYIIEKIQHFKRPFLKLPIMADFASQTEINTRNTESFVYCASIGYYRILKLVLESYLLYKSKKGTKKLTLILNGNKEKIEDFKLYIKNKNLDENVFVKYQLPFNDLLNEYNNAAALIIPLDPDYEQDKARFSQKIAEYISSKSPVITNKVGEVPVYFNDNEVVFCDFSITGFANAFKWIERHPEESNSIGLRGYSRGKKEFDFRKLGQDLNDFLRDI